MTIPERNDYTSPLPWPEHLLDVVGKGSELYFHDLKPRGVFSDERFIVLISEEVIRKIEKHARTTPDTEVFGTMIGEFFADEEKELVVIHDILRSTRALTESARITITNDAWSELIDAKIKHYPRLLTVGMYHSHPRWTVFLSAPDKNTHAAMFYRRYHVALVIDPSTDDTGVFVWAGKPECGISAISERKGFYTFRPGPRYRELIKAQDRHREEPAEKHEPTAELAVANDEIDLPGNVRVKLVSEKPLTQNGRTEQAPATAANTRRDKEPEQRGKTAVSEETGK